MRGKAHWKQGILTYVIDCGKTQRIKKILSMTLQKKVKEEDERKRYSAGRNI